MSSATAGATIRYTLDGSTPTSAVGAIYSGPVGIATTATVKAIVYKAGLTDSVVSAAVYTISSTPTISSVSPASGPVGAVITISGANFEYAVLADRSPASTSPVAP